MLRSLSPGPQPKSGPCAEQAPGGDWGFSRFYVQSLKLVRVPEWFFPALTPFRHVLGLLGVSCRPWSEGLVGCHNPAYPVTAAGSEEPG
jgi:hypothetical protein